jgi:hypothetical protein
MDGGNMIWVMSLIGVFALIMNGIRIHEEKLILKQFNGKLRK